MRTLSFKLLTIFALVASTNRSSFAEVERLQCPAGATVVGAPPPDGREMFCAKGSDQSSRLRHGPYRRYYPNGEKQMEGNYELGEKDGEFKMYYRSGEMSKKEFYRKGEKEGKWEAYYDNGVLRLSEEYRAGQLTGNRRGYFKNGNQAFQNSYAFAKKVGPMQTWHKSGNKQLSGIFDKDGKRTGVWTQWTQGGDKLSEGEYVQNKKVGVWKYWGGDGSLRSTIEYKNGRAIKKLVNKPPAGSKVKKDQKGADPKAKGSLPSSSPEKGQPEDEMLDPAEGGAQRPKPTTTPSGGDGHKRNTDFREVYKAWKAEKDKVEESAPVEKR